MRLHRLEIQGFGPFADRQEVDFDYLSEAGLFLLTGPTGAGKTSVLDAICFALFGDVPGKRNEAKLASEFRTPDTPCFVELEFTHGGQRYLVKRSPSYIRTAKRGGGTTKENSSGQLSKLGSDGTWQNLEAKPSTVSLAIGSLLRLDAKQFQQVALLPQGEFAKFLTATPASRRELLQQLFQTHRFGQVESELKAQAKVAKQTVNELQMQLEVQLQELTNGEHEQSSLELANNNEFLQEQIASKTDHVAELQAAVAEANQARQLSQQRLSEGEKLTQALKRREAASQQLKQLESEEAALLVASGQLDLHRKALPLRAARQQLVALRKAFHDANSNTSKGIDWVKSLEYPDVQPTRSSLQTAISDRQSWLKTLQPLLESADDQNVQEQLEALKSNHLSLKNQLAKVEQAIVETQRKIEFLVTQSNEAAVAAEQHKVASSELEQAKARLAAATQHQQLISQQSELQPRISAALDRHAASIQRSAHVRATRLDGFAIELALQLKESEPCSVCGSLEHPSPVRATKQAETFSQGDEDAAIADQELAREAAEQLRQQSAVLAGEIAVASRDSGGKPLSELQAEVTASTEKAQQLSASAGLAVDLTTQLESQRSKLDELSRHQTILRQQLDAAEQQVQQVQARSDVALQQQAEALSQLSSALQQPLASIKEAQKVVQHQATYMARVLQRMDEAEQAEVALNNANEAFTNQLKASGFSSEQELKDAVLPEQFVTELTDKLERANQQLIAAQTTLADPTIAAVAPEQPLPDLDQLAANAKTAQAASDQAIAQHSAALQILRQTEQRVTSIKTLIGNASQDLKRQQELHALADLVEGRGSNKRQLSLSSYVLAAKLQQVTRAATDHLVRMSAGRYELIFHEEKGDGQQTAGLGLRVRDSHTGTDRETNSLSGGETFYVSLALALGLAETVAAEAGGGQLQTLFIDEGFGSLDEQTLGDVFDVLDHLRSGGRTVGIVSHVSELKQRVSTQLQVKKTRAGSTLRIASVT